jgi:hypothetical protein
LNGAVDQDHDDGGNDDGGASDQESGPQPHPGPASRALALTVCFSRDAYRRWQRARRPATTRRGRDRSESTASSLAMGGSRQRRGSSVTGGGWGASSSGARRGRADSVATSVAGSEVDRKHLQLLAGTIQVVVASPIPM